MRHVRRVLWSLILLLLGGAHPAFADGSYGLSDAQEEGKQPALGGSFGQECEHGNGYAGPNVGFIWYLSERAERLYIDGYVHLLVKLNNTQEHTVGDQAYRIRQVTFSVLPFVYLGYRL